MKILSNNVIERKDNGIHTFVLCCDDYNVYYNGHLIARERNGKVSWVIERRRNLHFMSRYNNYRFNDDILNNENLIKM